jgi:RND family efflux transporter MFP subunit
MARLRGLSSSERRPRAWLIAALGIAAGGFLLFAIGLLSLPDFLHLEKPSERDPSSLPLIAVDPGEELAAPETTAPQPSGLDPYAALEPVHSGDLRSQVGGDDFWLEPAGGAAAEDGASTLTCLIEPFQVVEIGSAVTGIIQRIHVERSDFVEAGQLLVELESEVERAAVRVASERAAMDERILSSEASAMLGKRKRDRVAKLFQEDTLSLDLREEVETEAKVAQLELEEARAEKRLAALQREEALAVLERRSIHSPLSGVVVERMMSPGERVEDEPILKIAQIDPLRVEVILPSALFGTIEVGMRAAVEPEFPGDTVHVASVSIVDRVIDAASGTFGARLELPNPDYAIPGGLHCQVRFLDE